MTTPAKPKDAASVVLLRSSKDPNIYWVKRADSLVFMPGVNAFPGGQRDTSDGEIPVLNAESPEAAQMVVCAVRELFEETGVLIAKAVEHADREQLANLRQELLKGNRSFKSILMATGLSLDASMFTPAGRWVTPPFAPRRFDTWFFLTWLPENQTAEIIPGELVKGEWIRPEKALEDWENGQVLLAPPTLHIIRTLAEGIDSDITARLMSIPEATGSIVRRIEMHDGMLLFPVLTPTLPPATHTNCYIIGKEEFVIIDPASPYEEEQTQLAKFIDSLIATGQRPREILLTHFHPDHVGGVAALKKHLNIPVRAHPLTQEKVGELFQIDSIIADNEIILLPGKKPWRLRAIYTPGHAQDHICFFEERTGALVSGDLIVGMGTVVIDPPEGNMRNYLDSLSKVGELPLTALFGAHGAPMGGAHFKVQQYISHRLLRETNILKSVEKGFTTIPEIVKAVYTDVPEKMHKLAERSVLAHLEKLTLDGRVSLEQGHYKALSSLIS
ncbi:MAG: MBL fold metallo-hydrolase [Acidobacteria bacterium]|nr:MBL fold metallo-hydrolase [Acidobacteriota bacterium]